MQYWEKNATTWYSISTSSVWNQVWLPEYEGKTTNRQPNRQRKYIHTHVHKTIVIWWENHLFANTNATSILKRWLAFQAHFNDEKLNCTFLCWVKEIKFGKTYYSYNELNGISVNVFINVCSTFYIHHSKIQNEFIFISGSFLMNETNVRIFGFEFSSNDKINSILKPSIQYYLFFVNIIIEAMAIL